MNEKYDSVKRVSFTELGEMVKATRLCDEIEVMETEDGEKGCLFGRILYVGDASLQNRTN